VSLWSLDHKFPELTNDAVQSDGVAMPLGDDVVGNREAETGALVSWPGGEERSDRFTPDLDRYRRRCRP
jgi:hypothetical protein